MGVEGLGNLRLELENLTRRVLPNQVHLVVKKIAFEAFTGMVVKTPVDTGRARANWIVTINRPNTIPTEATDPAAFGSPPGAGILWKALDTINGAQPGSTIYVTNCLPYIEALEEGHSKQGAHMVELTVNEIKSHYGV